LLEARRGVHDAATQKSTVFIITQTKAGKVFVCCVLLRHRCCVCAYNTMGTRTAPKPVKKRSPGPEDEVVDEDVASPPKRARRNHEEENNKENDSSSHQLTSPIRDLYSDRNMNPQGKPPEAGVIQRIYVENFMCHRKLTVDLCRNVNFISGQNGSGKSAILAAIQICLGAGARRTHRARNLKELVRKDSSCACAKVRVTLLNRGVDGYKHEIYGDTITVERTIAVRGGYNGYKLLDANGKEQSRAKKDLDDMLDKLNIQVENPVAILDQEEAKKFLTGKSNNIPCFYSYAFLHRPDNYSWWQPLLS
jgi:hypothetical protein